MSIIQMPSSNFFPDTGQKKFVILHGTAGGTSAQEVANYFKSTEGTDNPVSTHYIVGQDGTIVQCVREKDGAYGNGIVTNSNWQGNPNYYTISIEHVKKSTDNSDELTDIQKQASFELIKDICERNNIAMHIADDMSGITGHFAIDPVNRARCPGSYPWQKLWDYLQGGQLVVTPIQPTQNQLQAASDCWDSVLSHSSVGVSPKGTGIYKAWLAALVSGKQYGPPITHEYASVNWDGVPIVVQEFAHARCEWLDGQASWYSLGGPA